MLCLLFIFISVLLLGHCDNFFVYHTYNDDGGDDDADADIDNADGGDKDDDSE